MVFASLIFLYVFLPINLILYFGLRGLDARNRLLIAASLLFYAWGEPLWILLLLASSAVNWAHGLWVERTRGTPTARLALVSAIGINLGLLVVCKYADLLAETLGLVLATPIAAPGIALPIGISFYTFQALSYVVDVHRGDVAAQRSWPKFLLYLSLYHQLIAGPIVRYTHVAAAIDARRHTLADLSAGVTRFCVGLFKKVCIANVAAGLVARTMAADPAALTVAEAWFGLSMFTLQIYFDFSAYSDMAIGLGRMFGFRYHENFDHPYVARSATEFWRRWHISLGSFFRDYVYIPLGGNRRRPYRNLFVVWALTGLWHGAHWNYVVWGLWFALLIALERLALHRLLAALPRFVGHAYLLLVVVLGWALFYFEDFGRLAAFLQRLFGLAAPADGGPGLLAVTVREHCLWLLLAVVMCLPVIPWLRTRVPHLDARAAPLLPLINLGALALATAMLVGKTFNPFLYFRF